MSLLFVYIFLCVSLTVITQIAEHTVQTTKSDKNLSQNSSTMFTVENDTGTSISSELKDNITEERQNITVFDNRPTTLKPQTDSSLVLTRTEENQNSLTNNASDSDFKTSSETPTPPPTTVSSRDAVTEVDNSLHRGNTGIPEPLQSPNTFQPSQNADNTIVMPIQETTHTGKEEATKAENQLERGTATTSVKTETDDNISDANSNLLTTSVGSIQGNLLNTDSGLNTSTFSELKKFTSATEMAEDAKSSGETTSADQISTSLRDNVTAMESASFTLENVTRFFLSKYVTSPKSSNQTEALTSDRKEGQTTFLSPLSHSNESSISVTEETSETTGEEDSSSVTMTNVSHSGNIISTTLSVLSSSSNSDQSFSTFPSITSLSPSTDAMSTSPPEIVFDNFTELTSENISLCLQESRTLRFHAVAGQIVFSGDFFNETTYERCTIQFKGPPDTLYDMYLSINTNSCYAYYLTLHSNRYFNRHSSCSSPAAQFQNYANDVRFQLTRYNVNASVELFFNFTVVPLPRLQVLYDSSTTGVVQTPDWDGKTLYPRYLDTWTRLNIPDNYSVMVSFLSMDIESHRNCNYDRLTLHVLWDNETNNETLELIHCNNKPVLKPSVFHTNALLFHFKTDGYVEHLGFRLYFSFHNLSEIPEKLAEGKWNCSVPYWPRFQKHLNCNMVEECPDGKDEEECRYTSDKCGRGFVSVASKCYIFISEDQQVTWNEAANECLRREAYLASLNSPREWNEVIALINDLINEAVYFGLQTTGSSFPELYHDQLQWADGSAVFYAKVYRGYYASSADCSVLKHTVWYADKDSLFMDECHKNMTSSFLCETDILQESNPQEESQDIALSPVTWQNQSDRYVTCPSGHVTLRFLACDLQSSCWASQEGLSGVACEYREDPQPPLLQCRNGVDYVPYTVVCDHRSDCGDNSDEDFCVFPSCRLSGKFQCLNKQCVAQQLRCDKIPHCLDGSDERQCPWYSRGSISTPEPPAIVEFDGFGSYKVTSLDVYNNRTNSSSAGPCPDTHFQCPGNLTYCMPVFVRCNGVYDCPGQQDEEGCDRLQCPGFYRCRASPICVHSSHLCDGVFQCPQRDDELLCELSCPHNCTCQGLAFYCHAPFPARQYPELRFLHAAESGITPEKLQQNSMLVYLNLAKCKLTYFEQVEFPNLRILDLSDNELSSFENTQMLKMNNLQKLSLARNPLSYLFGEHHDSSLQFPLLQGLDVSSVIMPELNVTVFSLFPKLAFLNVSGCGVKSIAGGGFQSLAFLKYLDLRGCPMTTFPMGVFKRNRDLKEVWADNYKLCCPSTLPKDYYLGNCHSPSDEISSCDALLRSDFYRIVLSVFAILALLGNLGSFVYRVLIDRVGSSLGFGAFVTHLCVSDFLMGVYLAMIGIADRMYQGNYLWKDEEWKQSTGCKVAGFLSLLSSEVSAFLICLITFDRFLVLRFPFSNVHFKKKSAHVACLVVWVVGVVFAGIPLLPATAHWQFYSQNGICIPLPITRNDFAGHDYSFGVIIIVNFILFLFIAAGQVFIYWSIRTNSMAAGDSNKKSNELTIARRLITIAMSDFLCWFPIGVLGLLASIGVPIPGEVNVTIAIIILPVNSAINPFLYTINMLMERRRRAQERRIQKMLMSTFASKYSETAVDRLDDSYSKSEALELIRSWLSQNLLSPQNLEKVVMEAQEEQKPVEGENK